MLRPTRYFKKQDVFHTHDVWESCDATSETLLTEERYGSSPVKPQPIALGNELATIDALAMVATRLPACPIGSRNTHCHVWYLIYYFGYSTTQAGLQQSVLNMSC